MIWLWWLGAVIGLFLALAYLAHAYVMWRYLHNVVRVFQEKPLFIVPQGHPIPDAENVRFPTQEGRTLCGCYLKTSRPRKGVILFGLEYGSNRWSCESYCEFLRKNGFDIFAFETRGQGESDSFPGYVPLQWVTNHEVEDFRAALAYLKSRPDADPRGIGFFGISKGGGAGLITAAFDPYIRCCVTDGAFATHTTMVPYVAKWARIFCHSDFIVSHLPNWYYGIAATKGLRILRKKCNCRFPHLEHVMHKLSPRPLFMIHGGSDNYIKPDMARALFDLARQPKTFWLVEGAKHNQALQVANGEYQNRVLAFFDEHLGKDPPLLLPEKLAANGQLEIPQPPQEGPVLAPGSEMA